MDTEKVKENSRTLLLFGALTLLPITIYFGAIKNFHAMWGAIVAGTIALAFSMPGILKLIKFGEFEAEFHKYKEEVDPIIAKESEPVEITRQIKGTLASVRGSSTASGHTSTNFERNTLVLKALASSKYARRTIDGIKVDTTLNRADVIAELKVLEKVGFVQNIGREKQYWGLTTQGRSAFQAICEEEHNSTGDVY